MPAPVNYSSKVPASTTVAEIQLILAKYGAKKIAVEYEGFPCALSFMLETSVGLRMFHLPVDIDKMHVLLVRLGNDGKLGSVGRAAWSSREHAAKVAWRIMKDWLRAQLALLDTEMVDLEVVMLPYLMVDERRTLYQAWHTGETLALEAAP